MLHSSDFPQAGNSLYGDEGQDTIFLWAAGLAIGARGFVSGGNGDDMIFQYRGDAFLDGGNGNDRSSTGTTAGSTTKRSR